MSNQAPEWVLKVRSATKVVSTHEQQLSILEPTQLSVKRGATVSIVGASGSGKSTLLSLLAGLDVPSSGEIELLGHRLDRLDEDARAQVRAGHVGFVFQSFMLLPALTALENVMLPAELQGLPDAKERAMQWLERVALTSRLQHKPSELSGGEQQRVAIARAFVTSPSVIFADEPTGNLDFNTGAHISDLLFEAHAEHQSSMILVTHDRALAKRCSEQYEMQAGQLKEVCR